MLLKRQWRWGLGLFFAVLTTSILFQNFSRRSLLEAVVPAAITTVSVPTRLVFNDDARILSNNLNMGLEMDAAETFVDPLVDQIIQNPHAVIPNEVRYVQFYVNWRDLEPSDNNFTFTRLKKVLDAMASAE